MKRLAVILAVLTVVLTATVAAASIPSAGGKFYGCVRADGYLVVKDDNGTGAITCGAQATSISWNETGPAGAPGVSGYEVVTASIFVSDDPLTASAQAVASCPAGKRVLGGGGGSGEAANGNNSNYDVVLAESRPSAPIFPGEGWWVMSRRVNGTQAPYTLTVFAICAEVG